MKPQYYKNPRTDVLSILPTASFKTILEVGGGDFVTLDIATEKYNAEGWGIDTRECSNNKHKIVQGSIERNDDAGSIPDNYFDLVLANDVIEHLKDTKAFFTTIHMKLKSSGHLAMSVPNIRQLRTYYYIGIKGTFPRWPRGLFDGTHFRWFCRQDIIQIATLNGFMLRDVVGVGRFLPGILSRTSAGEFLALQNIFLFRKC